MFGRKKGGDASSEWTKTGSFVHKPQKGWLHSDNSLMEGGVCYAVKYVGSLQVLKSMRTLQYDLRQQVTREAILRCSEAAGYHLGRRKKAGKNVQKLLAGKNLLTLSSELCGCTEVPAMRDSGMNVNMTVSSAGIKLRSIESGRVISNHDMQGISFASGGEKDCIDMIGYVAKDQVNGRACFVVDCGGGLAYDVINTIGQAFEIRFKMFLQNPPLATEVPERFSEGIFESDEHTYEMEYEEPKDDGQRVQPPLVLQSMNAEPAGYMALRSTTTAGSGDYDNLNKGRQGHGYDVPKGSLVGYEVPKNQTNRRNPVSGDYDNPSDLVGASVNRNGLSTTGSLKFAAGACYDNPDNTAFFENPLSAPRAPQRNDSLEQRPAGFGDSTYDNPSSPKDQGGWARFDDNMPSPLPPLPTNAGHRDYATPTSTPRKPPPVPKPYAESKTEKEKQAAAAAAEAAAAAAAAPPPAGEAAAATESSRPLPLELEVWYHGPMSRAEAELLIEDEGDFLVRESKSKAGQYVLSGVQSGQPRHLLLVDPEGKVRTRDRVFSSVQELVAYHVKNQLPIISSGSQVTISNPVLKH